MNPILVIFSSLDFCPSCTVSGKFHSSFFCYSHSVTLFFVPQKLISGIYSFPFLLLDQSPFKFGTRRFEMDISSESPTTIFSRRCWRLLEPMSRPTTSLVQPNRMWPWASNYPSSSWLLKTWKSTSHSRCKFSTIKMSVDDSGRVITKSVPHSIDCHETAWSSPRHEWNLLFVPCPCDWTTVGIRFNSICLTLLDVRTERITLRRCVYKSTPIVVSDEFIFRCVSQTVVINQSNVNIRIAYTQKRNCPQNSSCSFQFRNNNRLKQLQLSKRSHEIRSTAFSNKVKCYFRSWNIRRVFQYDIQPNLRKKFILKKNNLFKHMYVSACQIRRLIVVYTF